MNSASPTKSPIFSPVTAAVISILPHGICCGLPLLLIALGLGGILNAASISQYHQLFTALGIVTLVYGIYMYWKNFHASSCSCQTCSRASQRCAFCLLFMAGIIQVGMLAFFWSSASAAPASFEAAGIEADGIEEGNQFVYELKGLHCPGCAAEMEYKIQEMEGVESADILFSKKLLILETSLARTNLKLLAKNMRDLGYCELRMVYPQDETRDQSDGRDDINVAK